MTAAVTHLMQPAAAAVKGILIQRETSLPLRHLLLHVLLLLPQQPWVPLLTCKEL
jgi:hypothetical protein